MTAPVPVSPATRAAATKWQATLQAAMAPILIDANAWLQLTTKWEQGKETDRRARAGMVAYARDFASTQRRVELLRPFGPAPDALAFTDSAVALYVQAARVIVAATSLPHGPLRAQALLSYARIRYLADRIYDQGQAALKPFVSSAPSNPDVTIKGPPVVPSWIDLGMEAGPPLSANVTIGPQLPTPVPVPSEPDPSATGSAWSAVVARAGVPAVSVEVHAIVGTDAARAGGVADRLERAVRAIVGESDVTGVKANADALSEIALEQGLLVDAEAARAAQLADLAPAAVRSTLRTTAKALALIGDRLWDVRLGTRVTGFPTALLASHL